MAETEQRYIDKHEFARKHEITPDWAVKLAQMDRVPGAYKEEGGRGYNWAGEWRFPENAPILSGRPEPRWSEEKRKQYREWQQQSRARRKNIGD